MKPSLKFFILRVLLLFIVTNCTNGDDEIVSHAFSTRYTSPIDAPTIQSSSHFYGWLPQHIKTQYIQLKISTESAFYASLHPIPGRDLAISLYDAERKNRITHSDNHYHIIQEKIPIQILPPQNYWIVVEEGPQQHPNLNAYLNIPKMIRTKSSPQVYWDLNLRIESHKSTQLYLKNTKIQKETTLKSYKTYRSNYNPIYNTEKDHTWARSPQLRDYIDFAPRTARIKSQHAHEKKITLNVSGAHNIDTVVILDGFPDADPMLINNQGRGAGEFASGITMPKNADLRIFIFGIPKPHIAEGTDLSYEISLSWDNS